MSTPGRIVAAAAKQVATADINAPVVDAVVVADEDAPVAVDQAPERPRTAFDRITAHREGSKQPIVVGWLKVAEERAAILRWAVAYVWHIVRFHAVRLPVYELRFLLWLPRGVHRTVRVILDGVLDAEARPLR